MPKLNHIFSQSLACLVWFFFSVQASPVWADKPLLENIAFGSCADQRQPQPIWSAVFAYQPDVFIFAGDNVYGDVSSAQMTELKQAYARANQLEAWRHPRESYQVLATWDDHDYGLNDGGGDFPYKELAKSLFLDFWNVPEDDPRRFREGVYQAEIFGPPGRRVQIILLDTRSFRSPLKPSEEKNAPGRERYLRDSAPEKTLLGEEQWQWVTIHSPPKKSDRSDIERYTRIEFPSECILQQEVDLRIQLVVQTPAQTRVRQKVSITTDIEVKEVTLYVHITASGFTISKSLVQSVSKLREASNTYSSMLVQKQGLQVQ